MHLNVSIIIALMFFHACTGWMVPSYLASPLCNLHRALSFQNEFLAIARYTFSSCFLLCSIFLSELYQLQIKQMPKKMPLTSAEKQRRYREKLKEKDAEAQKEKERERWRRRVNDGKIKKIDDLTPRQQRLKRKEWKRGNERRRNQKIQQVNEETEPMLTPTMSRQKIRGRSEKRKDRSAAYRRIKSLECSLAKVQREKSTLQKRAWRANLKANETENEEPDADQTPRKRAHKMMRKSNSLVSKELVFHYALIAELKNRYQTLKRKKQDAQVLGKLFGTANILKKYRKIDKSREEFGFSRSVMISNRRRNMDLLKYEVHKENISISGDTVNAVKAFYLREDISRPTAGKKETVTRKKEKKQKHFLLESIKRTYVKFNSQHPTLPLSLTSFWRLKPFWVVRPTIKNRDTCKCKIHENVGYMHSRLKLKGFVKEVVPSFVNQICDDPLKKDCMYRECTKCMGEVALVIEEKDKEKDLLWWWQWQSVTETFQNRPIKKTKRIKVYGDVAKLVGDYNNGMDKLSKHEFNIKHQYQICKQKRENLKADELWLHIDFAENWASKSLDEIQATNWGGSHFQISLHTCVAYTGSASNPISICSISDNTDHSPVSIWHHLKPVLLHLKEEYPLVEKLHFMSDGPVTQYRGRNNMHLMANIPFELGYTEVWWNFSEASHGKGAADGVGAAVKRTADNLILSGKEIDDAQTMYNQIKELTTVKLFVIDPSFEFIHLPEKTVPAITGIMRVHQAVCLERGFISTRDVSCYCDTRCKCYKLLRRNVLVHKQQSDQRTGSISSLKTLEPIAISFILPAVEAEAAPIAVVKTVEPISVILPAVETEAAPIAVVKTVEPISAILPAVETEAAPIAVVKTVEPISAILPAVETEAAPIAVVKTVEPISAILPAVETEAAPIAVVKTVEPISAILPAVETEAAPIAVVKTVKPISAILPAVETEAAPIAVVKTVEPISAILPAVETEAAPIAVVKTVEPISAILPAVETEAAPIAVVKTVEPISAILPAVETEAAPIAVVKTVEPISSILPAVETEAAPIAVLKMLIENDPGKSQKRGKKKKLTYTCPVCNIVYNSVQDRKEKETWTDCSICCLWYHEKCGAIDGILHDDNFTCATCKI